MPGRHKRVPSYCLHRPSRKAVVRINGHDHYLGSHEIYAERNFGLGAKIAKEMG
jgi:hypothetical protein